MSSYCKLFNVQGILIDHPNFVTVSISWRMNDGVAQAFDLKEKLIAEL